MSLPPCLIDWTELAEYDGGEAGQGTLARVRLDRYRSVLTPPSRRGEAPVSLVGGIRDEARALLRPTRLVLSSEQHPRLPCLSRARIQWAQRAPCSDFLYGNPLVVE